MIKMDITDAEIDALAAERDRMTLHSRKRTVYDPDYSRKGICGEVALREFFDVNEKPFNTGRGDRGVDLKVSMLDRGNHVIRTLIVDVKCAVRPTFLWVEKPRSDVYVLARYDLKTRSAICIKWHWGEVVRNAPWKFYGKWHHEIPAADCLTLDELEARHSFKRCWCGADGNFGFDVKLLDDKPGRWVCFAHWQCSQTRAPNADQMQLF